MAKWRHNRAIWPSSRAITKEHSHESVQNGHGQSFVNASDGGTNGNPNQSLSPASQSAIKEIASTIPKVTVPEDVRIRHEAGKMVEEAREMDRQHYEAQNTAFQSRLDLLEANQPNPTHEVIADAIGVGVTGLTGAGMIALRAPGWLPSAPLFGEAAKHATKRRLANPPTSERDTTGMNGQDFEGINNF